MLAAWLACKNILVCQASSALDESAEINCAVTVTPSFVKNLEQLLP